MTSLQVCSHFSLPITSNSADRRSLSSLGLAPQLKDLQEIGAFSLTGPLPNTFRRKYHDDRSGLRALRRKGPGRTVKNLCIDLNVGADQFQPRPDPDDPETNEHLDQLLTWIMKHPEKFDRIRSKVNIVCMRKRLYEIMVTPYERMKGWVISACRIDGIIYLTNFETEEARSERLGMHSDAYKASQYWGYKFEQFMTNDEKTAATIPPNPYDGFLSIISSKLGSTGMLYAAEIDCYDAAKQSKGPSSYVECKTSRGLTDADGLSKFLNGKFRRWWAQSYIGGVPLICIGFRNDDGIVTYTDEMPTDIANYNTLYTNKRINWSPSVCVKFLSDFLAHVRDVVVEDHTKTIYKFEWNVGWNSVKMQAYDAETCSYKFIPEWFTNRQISKDD
ncbi:decapping and exoribonuclease protein-like [Paramacrobiotus metropolitanus]|uniref:decapping and exoribonuclease protein-like n=1 Tax=Paramacrobiotus metropolitanus TaxID=2943436 RepID=UPI002445CD56|nr:decapping and exoribonuclease protein-like [Paramacrobiotus metropolitanus]